MYFSPLSTMGNDTAIESLKEKIDGLNQLAWEVRVNDSPKAFQLSEESVKLARSINYTKGLAEGLRSLGFANVRLFKNEEAAPLLRESLSLFQSLNDIKGQAVDYEYLAIIERNLGNLGTSLELLLKGYGLIQQTGSVEIEITTCYHIGVTYKHLGNHENALDYLYKSLSIAKSSGNMLMEAYATNIIGSIYFDNGDYQHALNCYQQGLVIRRDSNDKWGEAGSLDNIGFTYLKLKDLDKAIDYCKQSLAISESTGDKKGESNALLHLAEIYEQAGDIKQASKFSNESLEIRKARGDRRGETEALLFLADLYKNSKDADDNQILEWLSGALKIAEDIKAQDLLSKAYYNLHEYYTQNGNFKESLINLEAHLQIEKELHKNAINQKISNLEISHKAEKISQRNKELTELNEKIEKANAELKIEASLERVRAVAMSMKKPDDLLSICQVLFAELELLGIKELRNAMVNIYNDEKNTFLNYDFSGSLGQSITPFSMINSHPVPDYVTKQIRQAKSPFAEIALTGDQLADWIGFREKHGELPDPKLKKASTLCYYFYSVGTAAIGISTLSSITKQEHEILKRFSNVFDLAYKRYTDIKQAEAQAKESQIQLALERVRARTMAMQKSDELLETSLLLFQQVKELGEMAAQVSIGIINEGAGIIELSTTIHGSHLPHRLNVPIDDPYVMGKAVAAWKSKQVSLTVKMEGQELKNYNEHRNSFFESKINFPEERWIVNLVFFSKGWLSYSSDKNISGETYELLKRFASVFEQTYTRFNDLKQAEGQTREAQIETGLERVRSKTMAMHKSEEVTGIAVSLNEELLKLGFEGGSTIIIINKETGDTEQWTGFSEDKTLRSCYVPDFNHPFHNAQLNAWKKGEKFLVYTVEGDEKRSLDDHFFSTGYKIFPENDKKWMREMSSVNFSHAFMKYGAIHWGPGHLTEEQLRILQRFANVFEQSYTRFLDLQKAEAQAREAQIEAALERVRSRSMAMHKSDELREVVAVLFAQLQHIGFDIKFCTIALIDKINSTVEFWLSGFSQEILPESYHVPNLDHPFYQTFQDTFRQGIPYKVFELAGEEKRSYDQLWFTLTDFKNLPEPVKKPMMEMERVVLSCAFTKNGMIQIGGFEPLSDTDASIVQRFAKVFEQTHTRFLDLQKAEAQAREAEIELALERVRARAMAMQKPTEFVEIISVIGEQFLDLDFDIEWVNFGANGLDIADGIDTWNFAVIPGGNPVSSRLFIPGFDHPLFIDATNHLDNYRQTGNDLFVMTYDKADKDRWLDHLFTKTIFKDVPDEYRAVQYAKPGYTTSNLALKDTFLSIGKFDSRSFTDEQHAILRRLGKAFGQAYTRFLDLQKAEEQAREAQIEAALERVRATAMAMHSSDDLATTISIFYRELKLLSVTPKRCGVALIDKETRNVELSSMNTTELGDSIEITGKLKLAGHPELDNIFDHWVLQKEYHPVLRGNEIKEYYQVLKPQISYPDYSNDEVQFGYYFMFKEGNVYAWTDKELEESDLQIYRRFSSVLSLTYKRYLDLKNAEAQAREAQIELGLEKVRAKAMAMHKSDDLKMAVATVFEELDKLDLGLIRCGIAILDKERPRGDIWITIKSDQHSTIEVSGDEPLDIHPLLKGAYDSWLKQEDFSYILENEDLLSYYQAITKTNFQQSVSATLKLEQKDQHQYYFNAVFLDGSIFAFLDTAFTDEAKMVMKRFANVFNLTYKRFLDLQKAEAQAREAQIELGLERVRARAMAMQRSDELKELIGTVSTELSKLDIILDRCFIMIYDIKTSGVTWWMANPETSSDPISLYVQYHEQVPYLAFFNAWQDRIVKWQYILEGSVKKTWDEFLFVETELSRLPSFVIDNMKANDKVYLSASFNNFGCLTLATLEPLADGQFDIMLRFAKVFDLTYTRFNDLQKAEAQAREARIETALEKVRASTMAMQRSEDLSQTAFVMFNQFKELGQSPERIFIATFDDHDNGVIDIWGTDQGGNELNKLFKVPVNEPTMVSKIIAAWKDKKRSIVVDLKGEELKTYLGFLKQAGIPVTEGIMSDRRVQTAACFSNGVIGVTTSEPQSAEAVQLQERFAGVFDLTYTRFLDLQKAEAQAREAKIETALERVRARALAMQQPEELKDVAQVLRNEMGALGVEELETCSIYIHERGSETAECWYALRDPNEAGKKMVSDHFHLELNDTWVGREMKKFYNSDSKQTSIVMQGANRKEWINYCYKHSPVFFGFYGETIPDRTYHLYKFSHGYVGAAAPGDISAESWRLLSRAASVFSLAYSRFKDLTQARTDLIKLKEEKKRAEDALTELQVTQKQLIQSEKMASLGELTAGIAHEIQNPLNFVNNFSDVSNELLEEMKTELEKGNAAEAKAIAIDVKENLEKILHHGKRADAIVKGMLQHSRSTSGQKELTDINTLADEYLRLAYHGLRAKDKFFNAKFETDLDPSITKINIVPQEIGRVILNLINNSFYAVNEKKRNVSNARPAEPVGRGYEPSVTVSTKKINDKVEIRVKDNGNGIPPKDLDKIFQPFFTTKPTGQGTGLGLSLSYDIVTKGHNGEIKVETKEGEGSAFIISLPMK